MQMQLEDVADVLEMLLNFYEWRDPPRTTFSLGITSTIWLTATFVPQWLLVKISFLAVGVMFFVLMPLAYRYPRYRRFTSPFIWTFWKIPTHADWAIARLQAEATQKLATLDLQENFSSTDLVEEAVAHSSASDPLAPLKHTDAIEDGRFAVSIRIRRYRCTFKKHTGNLYLSTHGVSFATILSETERWSIGYKDLQRVQKLPGKSTMRKGDDLVFTDANGQDFLVSSLKERDVVFSQLIGYSGVRWQRIG